MRFDQNLVGLIKLVQTHLFCVGDGECDPPVKSWFQTDSVSQKLCVGGNEETGSDIKDSRYSQNKGERIGDSFADKKNEKL